MRCAADRHSKMYSTDDGRRLDSRDTVIEVPRIHMSLLRMMNVISSLHCRLFTVSNKCSVMVICKKGNTFVKSGRDLIGGVRTKASLANVQHTTRHTTNIFVRQCSLCFIVSLKMWVGPK